ncbi:MAG: hypothetical protein K9N46_12460 [Candidatus Marinimicrobia bacterium]|nr:hypothetical protein [Candidatus Neomarinimicrobiota bacterium]MCF7827597.1 hypothetical protein [Candidatus Neomarinimicrobiota bacterium]MCF7881542.1 hypothetical protein [Candidatus Neomarinimicrobiota bacterium]
MRKGSQNNVVILSASTPGLDIKSLVSKGWTLYRLARDAAQQRNPG